MDDVGDIGLENINSRASSTADLTQAIKDSNTCMWKITGRTAISVASIVGVVLVVINIIITAVILGRSYMRKSDPLTHTQGPGVTVNNYGGALSGGVGQWCPNPNRTYLIQYGHDYGQYEYIDDGGYHRGFYKDLTKAVCEAAGVKCKTVYDKYTNCFTSDPAEHSILGTGLQDRYYDVCSGYYPTVERVNFARFTMPYVPMVYSGFFIKKGNTFDFDFRNKKIAFIRGWATSEKCVARMYKGKPGVPLSGDQVVYVGTPEQLKDQVANNASIAAGFGDMVGMRPFVNHTDIELVDPTQNVFCMVGGAGQVGRLDNDFIDIWNRGFLKILYNGKFEKVCEDSRQEHGSSGRGGTIDCIQGYNTEV